MMKKKPRKMSSKALKEQAAIVEAEVFARLSRSAEEFPSPQELARAVELRKAADIGHEWAESLSRFAVDAVPTLVEQSIDTFDALHPIGDALARETMSYMLRHFAVLGYRAAAKEAYDKQLAATATAVTKSQRKAAERRQQIVETFTAMTDGTKTDRVRRTANDLELSKSLVWAAVRDLD
jgi:hypothetical protein